MNGFVVFFVCADYLTSELASIRVLAVKNPGCLKSVDQSKSKEPQVDLFYLISKYSEMSFTNVLEAQSYY